MKRFCFVISCHNRKQKTIECISLITQQEKSSLFDISVILLDDGSTDGTSEAVLALFPHVRVIRGSGNLYWNGAMRQALNIAIKGDFDFYILLNDDTHIFKTALSLLVKTYEQLKQVTKDPFIVIGSTQDNKSGQHTYGGWRQESRWNPLKMTKVIPKNVVTQCDTLNGNCVLLSRNVIELVGNLDGVYSHSMGDLDYGLRATKMGCTVWVVPGFVGTCDENTGKGLWVDNQLPLRERWKKLLGPKGLPAKEWFVFTRRHAGWVWPIFWMNPYVKFWFRGVFEKFRRCCK